MPIGLKFLAATALVVITMPASARAQEGDFDPQATMAHSTAQTPVPQPSHGNDRPAALSKTSEAVAQEKPIALRRNSEPDRAGNRESSSGTSLYTVLGSLGLVLGMFFAAMWFFKRGMPNSQSALPSDVLEVFGRAALGPRQQVQLVRVGRKLILVAVTQAGVQTLTEIDDPNEVERLTRVCQREPATAERPLEDRSLRRTSRAKRRSKSRPDEAADVFEPAYSGDRNV
jgi:flagellar biosynthetic protein FliO